VQRVTNMKYFESELNKETAAQVDGITKQSWRKSHY
jgi:hypothetical protein